MEGQITPQQIKQFLRTQTQWFVEGKITEENLRFKLLDARTRYPIIDYDLELGLIKEELKKGEN